MLSSPPEPRGKWWGDNAANSMLRYALRHSMDQLVSEALRRRHALSEMTGLFDAKMGDVLSKIREQCGAESKPIECDIVLNSECCHSEVYYESDDEHAIAGSVPVQPGVQSAAGAAGCMGRSPWSPAQPGSSASACAGAPRHGRG
jgi:hypothetical protein